VKNCKSIGYSLYLNVSSSGAKAGGNPKAERDKERRSIPTFEEAVKEAHAALASGWSAKTGKGFLASLTEHAVPKLGTLKVDSIGAPDIVLALAPIWTEKPVMARKVRHRIGQVLAFAKARGWRTQSLPDVREMRSGSPGRAVAGISQPCLLPRFRPS
jgi:hypothetical protein